MTPGPDNPVEKIEQLIRNWELSALPWERIAEDSQKIGADFGKLALSSAVLLNGGALVVLPTMIEWLTPQGRSLVASMAVWFPIGITFAVMGILIAYANLMAFKKYAYVRAHQITCAIAGKHHQAIAQEMTLPVSDGVLLALVKWTQWIAVATCILSFLAFMLGVFGFIDLATYNTK